MTSDPISEELAKQVVSAIPQVLETLLVVGARFCSRRDLLHYSKAYRSALEADCSQMQILGMEQPAPIELIYTEVRLITRVKARMYKTIEELEAETRQEILERSLDSIRKHVLERLEVNVRRDRLGAITKAVDQSYQSQLAALRQQVQQKLKEVCEPRIAKMPLDKARTHIKDQYEHCLATVRKHEQW